MYMRKHQKKNILQDQAAFTLLEVMIAVAILAITFTMLLGSQSQSISLITEAQFNTQASLLSGLKLARLESRIDEAEDGEGDFEESFPGYKWKMEVETPFVSGTPILEDLANDITQVDLTITWGDERFVYTVRYFIGT